MRRVESPDNCGRNLKKGVTNSSAHFYNYKKPTYDFDNVTQMEDLVTDLKINIVDRILRETEQKNRIKNEHLNNVEMLTNKLKMKNEQLASYHALNRTGGSENMKLEHFNERVVREANHMEMELPMLKNRVFKMKEEIFEKDSETRQLRFDIYKDESEVAFLQEETRRLSKAVLQLQEDKKNMRAAVVLFKKQNDMLKEKVIKEDNRSKDFIGEVSTLLERNRVRVGNK